MTSQKKVFWIEQSALLNLELRGFNLPFLEEKKKVNKVW